MQRVLFLVLFKILAIHALWSQDIHQIKIYADEQYEKANYTIALKEYQRIFLFDNGLLYADIYEKIAAIYFKEEEFDQAITYYDYAWRAYQNDSIKYELAFKKILCYYRMQKYMLGLAELYDLPENLPPYFKEKKNLYFAICHYGLNETEESLSYFANLVNNEGYQKIDSSMVQWEKYQKKYDPDRLEMMSIFLPGLGQAYAGDFRNAANSFLLLTGIAAYSYYTMLAYTIFDGTLVLVTGFYRYYTGGHRKAYQLGVAKILKEKDVTYRKLLNFVEQHPVY